MGKSIFSILNDLIRANLHAAGIVEASSHYIYPRVLNEESLLIDLGANIGSFYFTLTNEFKCKSIAIEASPILFEKLPLLPQVRIYNYAICSTNGPVNFYLSENPEASSLQSSIAEGWGLSNNIQVEGITFATFKNHHKIQDRIDILKIDIEGAEIDLLGNMPADILKHIGQIPVEFHDFIYKDENDKARINQVIERLRGHNFLILKLSTNDWREVLCINKKIIKLSLIQNVRLTVFHPILQYLKGMHSLLSNRLKNV
ncbi:FkbM family methyltransferase [Paradesertivirga mongoliensis]|uniref:FkbM family methyltransferase n=1 Tax=Paradesertivirga mongoliensis TaxID=2100740 RepID=A0ABW4ZHP6_9SPHI|nr:FkbM family methyltransferase [Pedobacter mongoliensis]